MKTVIFILLLVFLFGLVILLVRILLFIATQIIGAIIIKLENQKKAKNREEARQIRH